VRYRRLPRWPASRGYPACLVNPSRKIARLSIWPKFKLRHYRILVLDNIPIRYILIPARLTVGRADQASGGTAGSGGQATAHMPEPRHRGEAPRRRSPSHLEGRVSSQDTPPADRKAGAREPVAQAPEAPPRRSILPNGRRKMRERVFRNPKNRSGEALAKATRFMPHITVANCALLQTRSAARGLARFPRDWRAAARSAPRPCRHRAQAAWP
jgi:hypothetical protein